MVIHLFHWFFGYCHLGFHIPKVRVSWLLSGEVGDCVHYRLGADPVSMDWLMGKSTGNHGFSHEDHGVFL